MPEIDYPVLVRSKTKFGRFVRLMCTKLGDSPYSVEVCHLIATTPLVYTVAKTLPFDDFQAAIGTYIAETADLHQKHTRAEAYVKTQTIAEKIAIAREITWGVKAT